MNAVGFIDSIRDRVLGLGNQRAAVVAMACALRLVATQASLDPEVAAAITAGRGTDREARDRWADRLEGRPDSDDDYVAATVYALRASLGSVEDAWWAVNRLIDAAFELATYPVGDTIGRPLDEDAAQPQVRRELDWLDVTLSTAEATSDAAELGRQLNTH